MNPFLRYLADKNSAHRQTDRQTHTQTDRQTDRHTPMITIPCGLRRAGKYTPHICGLYRRYPARLRHMRIDDE